MGQPRLAPQMHLAIVLAAAALGAHALPRPLSVSNQWSDAGSSGTGRRLQAQAEDKQPDWNVHDLKISLYWADDTSYWVPWQELATQTSGNSTYEAFKDRVKPIKDPQLMQMVKCVNDKHDPGKNLTWDLLMTDMGAVRVAAAWWATYPREQQTLTLVSASTLNRLNQVSAQCQSWPGAYSVTLYQPLLQAQPGELTDANKAILRDAVFQIFNFISEMKQQPRACKPDVLLVYEVFGDPYAKLLFPVNILRNLARLQARTPLVALLDVDLVVSQSLDTRLAKKSVVDHMISQARTNKTVYIIPAFEVNKGGQESAAWADVLALATKDAMSKSLKNAVTIPFDLIRSYDGHKLTNFKLWMSSNTDYRVEYEDGCEPWVLGDRFELPWFDPRYRGYGYNKIQHLAIMGAERFQFVVMHDAYCVHRAHKKSEVSAAFSDAALLRAVHGDLHSHNKGMFTGQMSQLKSTGTFKAVLSAPSANCKAILPWWPA